MKLSIIIPCFNEENTIKILVEKVLRYDLHEKEIIIVDDCSKDKSRDIIQSLAKNNPNIKYFFLERNLGKGGALKKGFNEANGDIILIQDADLEYDPMDYHKLIKPIKDGLADVVFGSRFLGLGERRVLYFWHTVGNKFLTLLSNMLSNLNLTDMEVCYKVFKSKELKKLKLTENRFGFEPEVTAKIARKNLRIYEVGVSYFGRKYKDGKKITWRDGLSAIRCIIKYNIF